VTVPSADFEKACGAVIVVITATSLPSLPRPSSGSTRTNIDGSAASSLEDRYIETTDFIKEFERDIGDTIAFWDRGRKKSPESPQIPSLSQFRLIRSRSSRSISRQPSSSAMKGVLLNLVRYRIAEVSKQDYERNESERLSTRSPKKSDTK